MDVSWSELTESAEGKAKRMRATAPRRIDVHAGNGYTEPREQWVECECGCLVWTEYAGYVQDVQPDDAWAEHVKWHEGNDVEGDGDD